MSPKLALLLGAAWGGTLLTAVLASLILPGVAGGFLGLLASLSVSGTALQPADLVIGALYGFLAGLTCGLAFLAAYTYMSSSLPLRRLERLSKRDFGTLRRGQERMMSIIDYSSLQSGKLFSGKTRAESGSNGTGLEAIPPARAEDMKVLDRCALCGSEDYSLAVKYNRFIMRLDAAPDALAARYDYSLCHSCGSLFAQRRPTGLRYRSMLVGFTETLGRAAKTGGLLNPNPLDDDDRADLARRAKSGVFVSDHSGVARRQWLPAVLGDRMANAVHVEMIGSLLDLDKPRVLELRPRTGAISVALRRLYGAEIYGMPIFESQQYIIQQYYDFPVDHLIDYENFTIPYDGLFDLIVSNHVLTHIVDPGVWFAELRSHLKPGAHLYLYNECDDAEILEHGGMVYSVLNPFHLQMCDVHSLVRALRANEFETEFITSTPGGFICLSRYEPGLEFEPIDAEELEQRRLAYRRARDLSILRVPEAVRPLFREEWPGALRRVREEGLADFDDRGRLVLQPKP